MPCFFEFFAGGGLARVGLGSAWECLFANDISPVKAASYLSNFPGSDEHFVTSDLNRIEVNALPGKPDLLWGSFPCQDLSLAGSGKGLDGARSGLIWKLLDLSGQLKQQGRGPKAIVLENVTGLLSSGRGQDFYDILERLRRQRYIFGALVMDAVRFVPQSRPRVFILALDPSQCTLDTRFVNGRLSENYPWTSSRLDALWKNAPSSLRANWVWWKLPLPPARRQWIADAVDPFAEEWDIPAYTSMLLDLMAPLHQSKVAKAQSMGTEVIGTLYRRTRQIDGVGKQCVEVRFDGISGCLRTPTGGSSRQRLLFVRGPSIRSRLLTSREAARLMGIPESYRLPNSYNDAYQLAGDGVAVPVVAWLAQHLLNPVLSSQPLNGRVPEVDLRYA